MVNTEYLQSLRARTKPLHESLENLTEADRWIGDGFDWSVYGRLLSSHYLFHLEVARHLESSLGARQSLLDWPACKRIEALEKDLEMLNIGIDLRDVPHLELRSYEYAVGLCYVAEGSCMGNQQLLKTLQKNPDFSDRKIDNFFQSSLHDFSSRWKRFLSALSAAGESSYSDMEKGSVAGFDYFKEVWLYSSPNTVGRCE